MANKNTTKNNNSKLSNDSINSKITAPSIKNTTSKSVNAANNNSSVSINSSINSLNSLISNNSSNLNNAIKSSQSPSKSASLNESSSFKTAKEEAGVYEVVSTNYMLLIGISAALIIIIIIYALSQSFRVGRAVSSMVVYQGYQQISSLKVDSTSKFTLGNYHTASAYNAAHSGYQMYDYTSEKVVLSILQSGARYLEFNVFNSCFGDKAYPVVSMGYKTGEWKMMINDTPLENIFKIISENAFTISQGETGVSNFNDPVIIGLNLNTNSNQSCLNLIAYLIIQYFGTRLLDNKYSFQQNDNIAGIPMQNIVGSDTNGGKVIIFTSDGYQGSGLDEIVNYSWDSGKKLQRINNSQIIEPSFNSKGLIEFNKTGMTIVVNHSEGDFLNNNYDPTKALNLGCQFVTMEYQYIDNNMDIYITNFKNSAFVLKDAKLR